MGDTSAKDSLELARIAYGEVLGATTHQDEKVGRMLTAVAFLTAASIAFVNLTGVRLDRRFVVDSHTRPLVAFAFGGFALAVVASVTLLVASHLSSHQSLHDQGDTSLVYFNSIAAAKDAAAWEARWVLTPDALRAEMARNYRDQTHRLALRARHKYRLMYQASAALMFALFCLGATVVLGVGAASSRPSGSVPFDGPLRWSLALYVAAYTGLVGAMALGDEWWTIAHDPVVVGWLPARVAIPPVLGALLVVSDTGAWRDVTAALCAIAAFAAAVCLGVTPRRGWYVNAFVLVCAAAAAVSLLPADDVWRLLAAVTAPASVAVSKAYCAAAQMKPRGPSPSQ
jgi:hypothetical protein